MPGQTVAVNVQMVLEMAGNIFPAFGEGVQCVGAVLELWWSKETGCLNMEEILLSDPWYSCKKQRELYHSSSSRETETEAESCTKQNLTCQSGASVPALGNSSCA